MLRRILLILLVGFLLSLSDVQSWAACVDACDEATKKCEVICPDGGSDGSEGSEGSPGKSGPRVCRFNGQIINCRYGDLIWVDGESTWCTPLKPQPPKDHWAWSGHTDGYIAECRRPTGDLVPDPGMTYYLWRPGTDGTPPDPEELARRILASLQLDAPKMGMFPKGDSEQHMSFVGWNMWLWSEAPNDNQWGPVSASTSEGGITVTLTAEVDKVVWDMGDGGSVTCGKGRPWSSTLTDGGRNIASPDCGYMYEAMGRYTVTTTAQWRVEWSGAGESGTIPLELTRQAPMRVGEIQSVLVANR